MLHRGDGRVRARSPRATRSIARIDGERRDAHPPQPHRHARPALGAARGARPAREAGGSLVAPERLRFDFSHHEALTREQLDEIEALANAEIIADAPVRHYETTKEHAESLGAIAFFGDKYGDLVRVLEAGEHSIELCGGTHVHALGFIGPIKIVSEGSIGANLRRIEAVTGDGALDRIHDEEVQLRELADSLQGQRRPSCPTGSTRLARAGAGSSRTSSAAERAKQARRGRRRRSRPRPTDGVVVARRDGLVADELRTLAIADARRARLRHRRARRRRARRHEGRARGRGHARTSSTRGVSAADDRARRGARRSAAAPPRTPTLVAGRRPERRRGRRRARAPRRGRGRRRARLSAPS